MESSKVNFRVPWYWELASLLLWVWLSSDIDLCVPLSPCSLFSTSWVLNSFSSKLNHKHFICGLSGIMAENESAKYRAMIDLTREQRLAVRPEHISLTGSLLASRLISLDNDTELRNTAHSEVERSARLVELIQTRCSRMQEWVPPCHYHSFIGILQRNQGHYRDILQQLEHVYQGQQWEDGNYDITEHF